MRIADFMEGKEIELKNTKGYRIAMDIFSYISRIYSLSSSIYDTCLDEKIDHPVIMRQKYSDDIFYTKIEIYDYICWFSENIDKDFFLSKINNLLEQESNFIEQNLDDFLENVTMEKLRIAINNEDLLLILGIISEYVNYNLLMENGSCATRSVFSEIAKEIHGLLDFDSSDELIDMIDGFENRYLKYKSLE